MKQLLFVAHSGNLGGPNTSLLKLIQRLPIPYQAKIVVPWEGDYTQRLREQAVRNVVLGFRKRNLPAHIWQASQSALVYGNSVNYRVSVAIQAAQLIRRPTIWHVREIFPDLSDAAPESAAYFQRVRQHMLATTAVIAVSKAAAKSVERLTGSAQNLCVVYNGIDTTDFDMDHISARQDILARFRLAPDSILIVQIGHIDERKNPMEAIEALAAVVAQQPAVKFILLGDSEKDAAYTNRIKSRIRELGLDEHIIFAGFQPDIRPFLCGADLQLHTALNDPHPRAVLEGMAAGLPVVAYATDGVAETIVGGETGYLIPQHDVDGLSRALIALVSDPAKREQMGKQGLAHVREYFQASHTADKVVSIIEKVLQR